MSGPATQHWLRSALVVLRAIAPRPSLWWSGMTALRRLARTGWWHRPPFLPVPGDAYWHFRLVTAYGGTGDEGRLEAADVVAFLQWCRSTRPHRG